MRGFPPVNPVSTFLSKQSWLPLSKRSTIAHSSEIRNKAASKMKVSCALQLDLVEKLASVV